MSEMKEVGVVNDRSVIEKEVGTLEKQYHHEWGGLTVRQDKEMFDNIV